MTATTTQLDLTLREERADQVNPAQKYSISRRKLCEYPAVSSNRNTARSNPTDKKLSNRQEACNKGGGWIDVCVWILGGGVKVYYKPRQTIQTVNDPVKALHGLMGKLRQIRKKFDFFFFKKWKAYSNEENKKALKTRQERCKLENKTRKI